MSAIDDTKPVTSSSMVSADIRGNFIATKNEIANAKIGGLTGIGNYNQVMGVKGATFALEYKTINGITNQINIAHAANNITISTPQDIHIEASPTFNGLNIKDLANGAKISLEGAFNPGDGQISVIDFLETGTTEVGFRFVHDPDANNFRLQYSNDDNWTDIITFGRGTAEGNIGMGTTNQFGDGNGVVSIANAATNPSTNPTNASILYSADRSGAGTATPHFKNEEGHIIKLYQQSHIADPSADVNSLKTAVDAILAALENTGQLATL